MKSKVLKINENDVIRTNKKDVVIYNNIEYYIFEQLNKQMCLLEKEKYDNTTKETLKVLSKSKKLLKKLYKL